jgi:hypothetical protein
MQERLALFVFVLVPHLAGKRLCRRMDNGGAIARQKSGSVWRTRMHQVSKAQAVLSSGVISGWTWSGGMESARDGGKSSQVEFRPGTRAQRCCRTQTVMCRRIETERGWFRGSGMRGMRWRLESGVVCRQDDLAQARRQGCGLGKR